MARGEATTRQADLAGTALAAADKRRAEALIAGLEVAVARNRTWMCMGRYRFMTWLMSEVEGQSATSGARSSIAWTSVRMVREMFGGKWTAVLTMSGTGSFIAGDSIAP
jgi:hypothetical protein